jgi:uncharacterized protein (TIGR02444 family)
MSESLWDFSLAFYARAGVADACLQCQDEALADVNLLLFLLWRGQGGARLEPVEIAAIDAEVQDWRDHVVTKLRAVRRHLKATDAAALHETIKSAELEAERLQQEALARHAASGRPGPDAASANLAAYAVASGRPLPPEAVAALLAAL